MKKYGVCPLCAMQTGLLQFKMGKYEVVSCDHCQLLYIVPFMLVILIATKKVAENKYSNGYSVLFSFCRISNGFLCSEKLTPELPSPDFQKELNVLISSF